MIETVLHGEQSPARFGQIGFRKVFAYRAIWRGRLYDHKEVEVIAVKMPDELLVITVIPRYF